MIDCTNYDFLRIVAVLKTLVTIVKIAVPLMIINKGTAIFIIRTMVFKAAITLKKS